MYLWALGRAAAIFHLPPMPLPLLLMYIHTVNATTNCLLLTALERSIYSASSPPFSIMADLQSKVTQLTSKIEGELTTMVDEIERLKLRPMGRNMHSCIVSCYDKAGKAGRKVIID